MIDPGTSVLFCFLHDFKCSTWQWGGLGKLYGSTIVSSRLVSWLFSNMREKFFCCICWRFLCNHYWWYWSQDTTRVDVSINIFCGLSQDESKQVRANCLSLGQKSWMCMVRRDNLDEIAWNYCWEEPYLLGDSWSYMMW